MECPSCFTNYDPSEARTPRILNECGHSICHSCLQSQYSDKQVECSVCHQVNEAESLKVFTKNMALLQLLNNNPTNMNSTF